MKVTIGKYINFFGIYQLFDLLQKVGVSEDKCFELAERYDESALANYLQERYTKKKRKVSVHIDDWDIWSVDDTLAIVVVPLLEKLREDKNGVPFIDNEDVPEHLHCEDKHHTEEDLKAMDKRWQYVLEEMLFAFKSKTSESDWVDLYIHNVGDMRIATDVNGWQEFSKVTESYMNHKGIETHQARITNGFRLFGKYYECLWT